MDYEEWAKIYNTALSKRQQELQMLEYITQRQGMVQDSGNYAVLEVLECLIMDNGKLAVKVGNLEEKVDDLQEKNIVQQVQMQRLQSTVRRSRLTARQLEVIGLSRQGLTNVEIAERLGIDKSRITHIKNRLSEMGVI